MTRARVFSLLLLAALFPPAALAYPTVEGHPAEYVILTGDALVPAFQPLADWKTRSGVPAVIRPLSAVLAAHPIAFDDAERIRLEIRDAWVAGARWVLLGGGPTVVPLRYARTTFFGGWDLPTDLYFQCLDGNWDADGDHHYGEGTISSSDPGDNADLTPEVYLGRAPVADFAEAQRFVAKTLAYQRTPPGGYEHLGLECAEVLFPSNWMPGDPVTLDGADLVESLLPLFDTHPSLHVARLYANYTDPGRRPGALPENLASVRDSLNRGANQVLMVGRGNTHVIGVGDAFMGEPDFAALTNGARLFNLYTVGTSSTAVDSGGIGRAAMLAPAGGAVSCIGSSHFEFPTAARNFVQEFFRVVEQDSASALGEAIARSRLPFIPFSNFDSVNRWTEMTQMLLGDPEMRMWTGPVRAMAVLHLPGVVVGDDHLDVLATAGSGPLAGARVCAWRPGAFLSVGSTDYAGFVHLPLSTATPGSFLLTVTGYDAHPYETTIDIASGPTPTLAALVGAAAVEAGVELTGFVPDGAGTEVTLQRSSEGLEWSAIASGRADGSGRVTLLDRGAEPGTNYHYRLAVLDGGIERHSTELEFHVPARAALAILLAGVQPSTGPVSVRLSLPLSSRVSIDGIDPSGRRRFTRELGVLAAGVSTVRLPEADALPPGVYFVRLRQGERSALTRFVRLQ